MKLTITQQKLHELALQKSTQYRRLEAELLNVIDQVDREKIFYSLGCNSLFTYCTELLGLSEGTTYNFTSVIRKSREVPALSAAVSAGLSIAKARRIAPVITKETQSEWIAMAESLPRAKLERAVAEASPEVPRVEHTRPVAGRRVLLTLDIEDELMIQVRRAQDLVSQSLGRPATLEDTLRAMATTFIGAKDPVIKADRNLARANSAKVNHVHARDRGACQMTKANGRACGATRFIHVHHRVPRHLGGGDDPSNLITLCSTCHRLWHAEESRRWAAGEIGRNDLLNLTWPGPSGACAAGAQIPN